LRTAPFGVPVEPDVFIIQRGSVSIVLFLILSKLRVDLSELKFRLSYINILISGKFELIIPYNFSFVIIATGCINLIILASRTSGDLISRFIYALPLYVMAISEIMHSIDLGRKTATGLLLQLKLHSSLARDLAVRSRSLKDILRSPSMTAVLRGIFLTVFSRYSRMLIII
jgi:hypothetical protein